MRGVTGWLAPLAVLLAPVGAQAQDDADTAEMAEFANIVEGLSEAFAVEPLTEEQAARLPAAQALVDRIIPAGSLQEVMGSMFDTMLSPLAEAIEPDPRSVVAEAVGLATYNMDLTDEQANRAATLFDPAWRERKQREADAVPAMTGRMMASFEPTMRQAMAELYAIYFTSAELADIAAFFATPSGATYAAQSLRLSSDPRMAGAMMQQMPAMLESMAAMEAEMAALTADLPQPRSVADLTPTELKGLAQLLGMSVEDLQLQAPPGDDWATDSGLE